MIILILSEPFEKNGHGKATLYSVHQAGFLDKKMEKETGFKNYFTGQ